jgi:hypothetical protein
MPRNSPHSQIVAAWCRSGCVRWWRRKSRHRTRRCGNAGCWPTSLYRRRLCRFRGGRLRCRRGFIGVGGHTPVDQVRRLHDREARARVHRRAAHVIGFSYTHDCDVRDVGPDNGITGKILVRCRRKGLRRDGGEDEEQQERKDRAVHRAVALSIKVNSDSNVHG